MDRNFFAGAKFNYAWEIPLNISLFGREIAIVVSADAYFSTDKVTEEQNCSYNSFIENYNSIIGKVENLLLSEVGSKEVALERFKPKMIKIKRNGDYGIVFDDKHDFENGLVITINPNFELMSTDEYF